MGNYYKLQERLEDEEKQILFDRKLDRIGQNFYDQGNFENRTQLEELKR